MSGPGIPFHLAFPVTDLAATRAFYGTVLGCPEGRSADRWVDFDFFGHQISAHLVDAPDAAAIDSGATNQVDEDAVPVRHFGAVLPWQQWECLAARLEEAGVGFLIAPRVRFAGEVGEQGTFFVADPSGNVLELKSFRDPSRLFARS
jgi:hypothetical protein